MIKEGVIVGAILIGTIGLFVLVAARPVSAATTFTCAYCGQTFSSLAALQNHVMTVHPGERIPASVKWD